MIKLRQAMIRSFHRFIAALLALLLQFLPVPVSAATGLSAFTLDTAGFSLSDLQGERAALEDYRGKVVLVNFWASWCPPCIYEMPALERLGTDLADRPFAILAINTGEQKYKVWKFTRLIDLDLPVLLDTDRKLFDDWQVMTLPTSFLLDGDGQVRYRVQGAPDRDSGETRAIINQLLQEEKTQ